MGIVLTFAISSYSRFHGWIAPATYIPSPLARIIHVGWVKVAQLLGGSSQTA